MTFGAPRGPSGGPKGLGKLKMDEIDAANSFLRLPMVRNGLKWPVETNQKSVKNTGRPSASTGPQGWPQGSKIDRE